MQCDTVDFIIVEAVDPLRPKCLPPHYLRSVVSGVSLELETQIDR